MGNLFEELRRMFPNVEPRPCKKIGHLTRASAEAQLASLRASPDCVNPDTLRIYECGSCRQLHVGHPKEESCGGSKSKAR